MSDASSSGDGDATVDETIAESPDENVTTGSTDLVQEGISGDSEHNDNINEGDITGWSEDAINEEAEADVEDEGDEQGGDEWEWQLRVVQRVSEGMSELSLFTSGGFDFVVVLNLQQNSLKDLAPIVGMGRTLRVLNVAQNELATLPDVDFWSNFRCLTMCFLSQNSLSSWTDVQGLEACSGSLLWLTLANNPLMWLKNARSFIVNKLPFLKALDNFVTTDQEVVQHARSTTRFGAQAPRLSITRLAMPLEFENDDDALRYASETEAIVARLYADNSPSVRAQKLIRGYLSRRANFPRFRDVRGLIIHVQKHIRGFLLRQLIKRHICDLVTANGESKLLMASVAAGHGQLSPLARRSFEKMLPMVRRWRVHFQAKKRAIAIKKIRFWCQMVYQRHARRTRQLLREQQEIWIYYTPEFEQELLTLAARVARRDPFLMTLPRDDRLQLLRERCAVSGISVLRGPNPNSDVVRLASSQTARTSSPVNQHQKMRLQHEEDEGYRLLRMGRDAQSTLDEAPQSWHRFDHSASWPALVRAFPGDIAHEHKLLVAEKQFLQQDLERISSIQNQHRQAVANSDADGNGGKSPTRLQMMMKRQPRAVMVHLAQTMREVRQRLVICNRKILSACVKQQVRRYQQHINGARFSLARVKIRARGHAPARWERKKLTALLLSSSSQHSSVYPKMKVFIPWTIDMYLHIVASLDRAVSMCSVGPAKAFALPYEDVKRSDAALLIQSVWRASLCHSKRNTLEVTIARALVCIQRWWRYRIGIRRRLDVLRACLLVGAGINSRTMFMEASVYHALVDNWAAVHTIVSRHRCHEHRLHSRIGPEAHVELILTPGQVLLHNASRDVRSILLPQIQSASAPSSHINSSRIELWASQRCSAYFPVWMPGAPAPEEESMASRAEDAAPLLLLDGVQAEPTLLERELMLGDAQPPIGEMFSQMNPFSAFSMCHHVVGSATRIMGLAHQLSAHKSTRKWQFEPSQVGVEATSFVRLTFESIDEARKRALVLLCKTFDPVTKTYARMFSLEALYGAAFRHHQWALSQAAKREEVEAILKESRVWLQDEFPSRWWLSIEQKMEAMRAAVQAPSPSQRLLSTEIPPDFHVQRFPPREPQVSPDLVRTSEREVRGPPRVFPRPPPKTDTDAAAPLHVVVSELPQDAERHRSDRVDVQVPSAAILPAPPRTASPSTPSFGSSRHQMLLDRLGKPRCACIEDMRYQDQQDRERHVRDLREESERAMEALIVDRRMLQRERATEVASIKLDIDVKLQRMKYEHELEQLSAREVLEAQRHTSRRRKLTRKFETAFVAQSGALMRRAARATVATSLEAQERKQQSLAAAVRVREAEALERRREAKSFWFVKNRHEKRDVDAVNQLRAAEADKADRARAGVRRQKIREDKHIKQMLSLM